jgi:hypothetical protein
MEYGVGEVPLVTGTAPMQHFGKGLLVTIDPDDHVNLDPR